MANSISSLRESDRFDPNSNDGSEYGNFGARNVVTTTASEQRDNFIVKLCTEASGKFLLQVKKYLETRDIQNLRLTCKAMRNAVFEYIIFLLSIKHVFYLENILNYLSTGKFSLMLPSQINLYVDAYGHQELFQTLEEISTNQTLKSYTNEGKVEKISLCRGNGHFDPNSIGEMHTSNIIVLSVEGIEENLELSNYPKLERFASMQISGGVTLDLSRCQKLKTINVGHIQGTLIAPVHIVRFRSADIEDRASVNLSRCTSLETIRVGCIYGGLQVPSSLKSFKCEHYFSQETLDLSHCNNLKEVMMGNIEEPIKLPNGLTIFECSGVHIDSLDFGQCLDLEVVKIEKPNRGVILPPNLTNLEYEDAASSISDLQRYFNLSTLKIGEIDGALTPLPPGITSFQCGNVASGVVLDLRPYSQLKVVKVGKIMGVIQLPPAIEKFECEEIPNNSDLSSYQHLKEVKIHKIGGYLKLPSNIRMFECRDIESTDQLDWDHCTNLTVVKTRYIKGNLKLPACVSSFEGESDHWSSGDYAHFVSGALDLSQCFNLKEIRLGVIYSANLKLPANLEYFECKDIFETLTALDLSQYSHLTKLKIGSIHSKIKFPPTIQSFECGYITSDIDLSHCMQLKSVKIGFSKGTIKFSPSIVSLVGMGINGDEVLKNLQQCLYLEKIKLGANFGTSPQQFKLPSSIKDFLIVSIPEGIVINLSDCKHLTAVEVKNIYDGRLILPANIKEFKCEYVISNSLDLRSYVGLAKIDIDAIQENVQKSILSASVTSFSCRWLCFGSTLDLSSNPQLKTVNLGHVDGTVILPSSIENFTCISIGPEARLNLVDCINLTKVTLGGIDYPLQLPASITDFQCRYIGSSKNPNMGLDLSHCLNLQSINIGNIQGRLTLSDRLPGSVTSSLAVPIYNKISWSYSDESMA